MIPQTILVAVDGSQESMAAERFAADLANRLGDTHLLLAHVIPPAKLPPISPPQQPSLVAHSPETGRHLIEARKLLAEAEARVRALVTNPTVTITQQVIEAPSPAKGLVDRSENTPEGCRMIVMGNRGHSELASLVLGSVASQVLHAARCPVVIVRR